MKTSRRSSLSLRAAAFVVACSAAVAQTTFPEVEPNSSKTDALVVNCMTAGDMLTGTSTGATAGTGLGTLDTSDYFKITRCAQPAGIYRHTLTLTTGTPGHAGSLRGLAQTGTPGIGGAATPGSDVALQNLTGTQQIWYGFGLSETVYARVSGTVATTGAYTHTLSTATVVPTSIGNFTAGTITITTENQGHTTDTDFAVFDASFNAIPGFANDDTYPPTATYQGTLTRTYGAGTYYLALGTWNLHTNQPAANDDNYVAGGLHEFGNVASQSSAAVAGTVSFAVTDPVGTTPIAATKVVWWEILWFKFTVTAPGAGASFCVPGAGGVSSCACGNPNGAGVGCANTGSSGGSLASTGVPSVAADATDPGSVVLAGSSMLSGSTCIFLQGDGLVAAGANFGGGIRCTGGQLFRLKVSSISGGGASYPIGADRSITNRSSDLGTPIGSGATRYYQTYYRDPSLPNPGAGCPTNATFNITSGQVVVWGP